MQDLQIACNVQISCKKVTQLSCKVTPRHLKVRSTGPHPRTQKKAYKDIPVQKTSPLWTGKERLLHIHGVEYEVTGHVEEKEYGRKKMLKALEEQAKAAQS